MTDTASIRNFSIIAHIDHGKSTLADRILERTGALSMRESKDQFLDSMDLERERGITIKARSVRLNYTAKDDKNYVLNLIDTPGHVDFAYEVSRSLAACEGALLVVDASQGVEAQTLANVYQAVAAGHEIVPVLNKIDLPAAEPDRVKEQIEDVIGLDAADALLISAKTGLGIEDVLEALVHRLPPPQGDRVAPLKALLVDSWYDAYLGVVILVRDKDGALTAGQKSRRVATGASHSVERVGVFTPKGVAAPELGPGEIGFITASIKTVADCRVGDTITEDRRPAAEPLPGFQPVQPVVFCGFFPTDAADYERLRGGYVSLQQKYEGTLQRANASTALMDEMAQNVRLLRESQTALVKSTMGEDQASALDARLKSASEDGQRQRAAQSAMQFIEAQTRLFTESLQAAGIDTTQIAWPTNAQSVQEWFDGAKGEVLKAIGTSREKYVKAVEQAATKAKEAAKVDAEKIVDKSLKEAGVGRIDSTKGAGASFKQRLDSMNPTSPEFQQLIQQAKRGDLTKI